MILGEVYQPLVVPNFTRAETHLHLMKMVERRRGRGVVCLLCLDGRGTRIRTSILGMSKAFITQKTLAALGLVIQLIPDV